MQYDNLVLIISNFKILCLQALTSAEYLNWWSAWRLQIIPDSSGPDITDGQAMSFYDLII